MNPKATLPLAGLWLGTIAAAYYLGSSTSEIAAPSSKGKPARISTTSTLVSTSTTADSSNARGEKTTAASASTPISPTGASATSLAEILNAPDAIERSRLLLAYIDTLSADQFQTALAEFEAQDLGRGRFGEYTMLLTAWAKKDPLAALEYSQSSRHGRFTTSAVLATWAADDPQSAVAWARNNHTGDNANPWFAGIIKGIAQSDPQLATTLMLELPYSQERGEALYNLIPAIAKQGSAAANQWISSLTDPRLAATATARLADQFSKQDPATGAQWASTISDPEARQQALAEVAGNWAQKDPSAALTWMQTLTADEQAKAGPHFVNAYATKDANAAADWLDQQVNAENYQQLLQEFAQGAADSDPLLALNYGNELEDEQARTRTVGRTLWMLSRTDRQQAQTWIQNNQLPERLQQHVNRMFGDQ